MTKSSAASAVATTSSIRRRWDEVAARTRLAASGAELRARGLSALLSDHVSGPTEIVTGQLAIVERGVLGPRRPH